MGTCVSLTMIVGKRVKDATFDAWQLVCEVLLVAHTLHFERTAPFIIVANSNHTVKLRCTMQQCTWHTCHGVDVGVDVVALVCAIVTIQCVMLSH